MQSKRLALAICLAAPFLIASSSTGEREIGAGGLVAGSLNAIGFRLRIDPAATAMPIITTELARRARLKAGFMDWEYQIGPRVIEGRSAIARIDFGAGEGRRRVGWTDRPYAAGIDGVVGPGMLDQPVIRFVLRAPQQGERSVSLPLIGQGGLEWLWGERFAAVMVGNRRLRVQFDPYRPLSVAIAQAGVLLAAEYGGHFVGDPHLVEVAYGIERPVRRMVLQPPFVVGPLRIGALGVRMADFGTASNIPTTAPDPQRSSW